MASETIEQQFARHGAAAAAARRARAQAAARRRVILSVFRDPGDYEVVRDGRRVATVRVSLVGTNRCLKRVQVLPC